MNKATKISWKQMSIITIIITILLSYGVYYTYGLPTEEKSVETLCTYTQKTNAEYSAQLKPNILYEKTITNGEPIYLNLLKNIDTTYNYEFECSQTGDIITYHTIDTIVKPVESWNKTINELIITETTKTNTQKSSSLEAQLSYNFTKIIELIEKIEENIGFSSGTYQIITTIKINTTDQTQFGPINNPMEERIILTLSYMGGYMEKSGIITVELPRTNIPDKITTNTITEIESVTQSRIGLSLALVAWITVGSFFSFQSYKKWKTQLDLMPESKQIMKRYKVITAKDMPDLKIQTLASMDSLKKVVDDYESMIFHTTKNGNDVFFTTIQNITYQYITNSSTPKTQTTVFPEEPKLQLSSGCPSFIQSTKAFFKKTIQKINSRPKIVFLSLFIIGVILLTFSIWITYYDLTFWNKNLTLILLGPRTGETMSLGVGMRLIYYFILSLTLISTAILRFFLPKAQIIKQLHTKN